MVAAPALQGYELPRVNYIGAAFLGICGDPNHSYGYHINSSRLPASDYSMQGTLNRPVGDHCCAIDIGMNWPASRDWLRWLIREIREDRIQGISEVIGSLNGSTARYWSDSDGWGDSGVPYSGSGHVTWTHVGIYRSTALQDHGILRDWSRTGYVGQLPSTGQDDDDMGMSISYDIPADKSVDKPFNLCHSPAEISEPNKRKLYIEWSNDTMGVDYGLRIAANNGAGGFWFSPEGEVVKRKSGFYASFKVPSGTRGISVQRRGVDGAPVYLGPLAVSLTWGPVE